MFYSIEIRIWILIMSTGLSFGRFEYKLDYTLQENHPSSSQIGHISNDILHQLTKQNQRIRKIFDSSYIYKLRDETPYFFLDSKTSVLKTAKVIDLEILCPKFCNEKGEGNLNLVVNVWKLHQLQGVVRVSIIILDQNDNVPTFPVKVFLKKIKEVLYGKGKFIELPKAVDKDVSKPNNVVSYELSSTSDTFELSTTKDGLLRLKLLKDIDYESQTQYRLTLIAWNEIQRSLKSYLEIQIDVIDINDCAPKFNKRLIETVVDENAKIGKDIIQLEATDQDKNSHIEYEMLKSTSDNIKNTFIVHKNGSVVLKKSLDVEQEDTYEISITASDGEFTDSTKLRILVKDVNNHPPSYNLNPAILSVEENQPAQQLIGQILVKDVDSVIVNGEVRCSEPRGKSNLQALTFQPDPARNPVAKQFDVYSRVEFDREEADEELVYLICHDGGLHQRLTSTLTISLQILDVNDNPPVFSKNNYTARVSESNGIGEKVIQITATDPDAEANSKIQYSLQPLSSYQSPHPNNIFFIEPTSGWVTIMRVLDRESVDRYQLTIIATNISPKQTYTATTQLVVSVADINDNKPHILPPKQFEISENLPRTTWIGQINARDEDSGNNGKLAFSLVSHKYSRFFEIKRNGSLYSRMSFDREIEERYCIGVKVSDYGQPISLSATSTICVLIVDVNDNAPVIQVEGTYIYPNQLDSHNSSSSMTQIQQDNSNIIASIHDVPGQSIAKISAKDADKDLNSECYFILEDVDDSSSSLSSSSSSFSSSHSNNQNLIQNVANSLFIIDENEKTIKISRIMNRDHINKYVLKIVAHDRGSPSLRSEKIIVIEIRDIPARASQSETNNQYSDLAGINFSGNVMIVIVLSTVSACLTALLIGAILCMIRPCCCRKSTSSMTADTVSGATSMAQMYPHQQGLLQKLTPPDYYNMNNYRSQTDGLQWRDSVTRGEYVPGPNLTLDCYSGGTMQKGISGEIMTYDMVGNLCGMDHVVGKPSGCSCGQGVCLRYGNHASTNCLLSPEEQCSDSGRGASDDDMKNMSIVNSNHSNSIVMATNVLTRPSTTSAISSPNNNVGFNNYQLLIGTEPTRSRSPWLDNNNSNNLTITTNPAASSIYNSYLRSTLPSYQDNSTINDDTFCRLATFHPTNQQTVSLATSINSSNTIPYPSTSTPSRQVSIVTSSNNFKSSASSESLRNAKYVTPSLADLDD